MDQVCTGRQPCSSALPLVVSLFRSQDSLACSSGCPQCGVLIKGDWGLKLIPLCHWPKEIDFSCDCLTAVTQNAGLTYPESWRLSCRPHLYGNAWHLHYWIICLQMDSIFISGTRLHKAGRPFYFILLSIVLKKFGFLEVFLLYARIDFTLCVVEVVLIAEACSLRWLFVHSMYSVTLYCPDNALTRQQGC